MSAEKLYKRIASRFGKREFNQVISYYEDWNGQETVDLKFRYIKLFGINRDTGESDWYNLHHLLNIRRFKTELLPKYINSIISDLSIYPLRIFHSCTEWLAPNEVGMSDTARIIRSGIIPFENDSNLKTSLQVACKIRSLYPDAKFVYSGNKSIHSWLPFSINTLDQKQISYADKREEAEKHHRLIFFEKVQKQCNEPLDRRISTDPRRVIPILNSLNALTMRKVLQIPEYRLCSLDAEVIKETASISG